MARKRAVKANETETAQGAGGNGAVETMPRGPVLALDVELGQLVESPLNPRTHYDPAGMAELVKSVRASGLLTPLLVRTVPGKHGRTYEIVAGSRRFRAAKEAGLGTVPVRVMELTDDQAAEAAIIENLQRRDVEPLDEAVGFAALLTRPGWDVAEICRRVGKPEEFVRLRIALSNLIPAAAKALEADKIRLGHAQALCRLIPAQQEAGMKYLGSITYRGEIPQVGQLQRWIEDHVLMHLSGAPFSAKNPDLYEAAGACVACPKRTGASPVLFPEVKKGDRCLDPICFGKKSAAAMEIRRGEIEEREGRPPLLVSGESYVHPQDRKGLDGVLVLGEYRKVAPKDKRCDSARSALVVHGAGKGSVLTVCPDPKCKTHGGSSSSGSGAAVRSPEEKVRAAAEREKSRQRDEVFLRARKQAVEALCNAGEPEYLGVLGEGILRRTESDRKRELCKLLGLDAPKSARSNQRDYDGALAKHLEVLRGELADLRAFLAEVVLINIRGDVRWGEPKRFVELAGECGVDVAAIAAEVKAEADAKKPPKQPKAKAEKKAAVKGKRAKKGGV